MTATKYTLLRNMWRSRGAQGLPWREQQPTGFKPQSITTSHVNE